jgi:hypothetical protein
VTAVRAAWVVVPAHDEAERLPACLGALRTAVDVARRAHPGTTVRVMVVLDRCADGSADVVRRAGGVELLEVAAGSAGSARAAGVARARRGSGLDPRRVWLATTDADSRVPPAWLAQQLDLAAGGVDLVLGTVTPDPDELSEPVLRHWRALHRGLDLRVYGASLGLRLSAHDSAGGFPPLAEHEDVTLVRRVLQVGASWAHGTHAVVTSGRLHGRAPGGFSGYLTALTRSLT